jgi:hypothetical protein
VHESEIDPAIVHRSVTWFGVCVGRVARAISVVPVFGVTPGTIEAGDNATLSLQLNLFAEPGYYGAQFTGGSATLYSGEGSSAVFNIGGGGSSRSFNAVFNYADAGSFFPSYTLTATYQQLYDAYVYLYTYTYQVIVGYGYYSCGLFGHSTCSYPIYGWAHQPVYGWQQFTAYGSSTLSGSYPLTVTPIPGALVLFATGVGFLLALFRRGKPEAA